MTLARTTMFAPLAMYPRYAPPPLDGERQPLLPPSSQAPTVIEVEFADGVVPADGRRPLLPLPTRPPRDVCEWIVQQWNATVAFESLTPIPLHVAAMGVGLVVCLVADKRSYIDQPTPKKGRRPQPTVTTMPPSEHFYTWHHVLLAVLIFDLMYSIAWIRYCMLQVSSFPTCHRFCKTAQVLLVFSSQVLFFLHVLDAVPMTWFAITAPLAVYTILSAVQLEWQALLGLNAIAVALKADGVLAVTWLTAFMPIWAVLALIVPLGWLLPRPEDGTTWSHFKRWFWLVQVGAVYAAFIPLAIKLEMGSTVLLEPDGSHRDWLPYRVMVAVWLLPVTCLVVGVCIMVAMVECALPGLY
ncbi:hypothetical protein H257_12021 [Aphanomyces astaci]|uniref:Uncharacterized protein n=1 Tax=Aphanomyces astaci TaxID=112090 RepID=W4G2E8_APHAT|nr:hypothetical protein H257_12021 [Aphanomyces astaci]ETV73219.1 hypothetical protein H257_12021 [Aphanomyces astaci]|eukprot:XP_009837424.1 hypothetical protein H257_12021 [Aphanomyces astaci]